MLRTAYLTAFSLIACQAVLPLAARADCGDDEARQRHSAAGGVSIQALWLNTDPIRDLAQTDRYLRGKRFDFNDRVTPMVGLTSFHETDAGMRTGGGAWVGYKLYESATFTGTDSLGNVHDSLEALRIIPVYGGFSAEKALRFWQMDVHGGALIGGGVYLAHRAAVDVDNPSIFHGSDTVAEAESGSWGAAGFGTVEFNAGVSVTVAPMLQVGLDGVLAMVYSPEGFGVGYGDFYSLSPGIRLRLLVGRV